MSGYAPKEIQKALYQKLSGDATLTALVEGIYDHVPPHTPAPYITLGEIVSRDWSTTTTTGSACALTLRIFSGNAGRKEAAAIMERIHALLHRGMLTVTGQTLVLMRFESSEIRLQDDGATYQGMMRFKALFQE